MRTTVDIDDDLLARAKARAVKERRSVRSLIEEGLRKVLKTGETPRRSFARIVLPLSTAPGGTLPGIDINSNAALLDVMESDDIGRHVHPRR